MQFQNLKLNCSSKSLKAIASFVVVTAHGNFVATKDWRGDLDSSEPAGGSGDLPGGSGIFSAEASFQPS